MPIIKLPLLGIQQTQQFEGSRNHQIHSTHHLDTFSDVDVAAHTAQLMNK